MKNSLINYPPPNSAKIIQPNSKILIVHLSAIGDVILTLPAAHSLRTSFPNSYIAWVVEEAGYQLLKGHPELDEVILFPKSELKKIRKEKGLLAAFQLILAFRKKIRAVGFDIAIDFHNMFKSGVIALLSGAKIRVGFGPGREGNRLFLTKVLKPPAVSLHFVDWELELASRLGANTNEVKFVFPAYQKETELINNFLKANSIKTPFFCVAPGTSWPNKCWSPQRMAELIDRLSEYGQVIITGAEPDRKIVAETKNFLTTKPLDVTGMFNLRELAVLLGKSSLFFGGDTGPLHLAAARGTNTIAWMGPTKPDRTGPYPGRGRAVSLNLSCQYCHKKICPNTNNSCLKDLPFEMVWSAAKPYLEELERNPKQ